MELPRQVSIREEGPRDGWQNIEDLVIPTDQKIAFIEGLVGAGLRRISVTSMVHPKWVPQLADGPEVVMRLERHPGVSYGVLVPNRRGFDRALELRERGAPIDEVSLVVSVSEAHNRANVNMSVAESLVQLREVIRIGLSEGLHVCAGMATVFGCSLSGRVPVDEVSRVAAELVDAGATELTLGDTTGMANPLQVQEVLGRLRAELPGVRLTPHFHNTRGAGLANVLAAMQVGVDSFEAAYGELGGCQFAKGATGNIATEDLACMLGEMGIDHGVDIPRLLEVVADTERLLGRRMQSHVSHAGLVDWEPQEVPT